MSSAKYTISEVENVVEGSALTKLNSEMIIDDVLIDSRKAYNTASALFFALVGERNNGHHYLKDVYRSGVRNFIVSEEINVDEFPNASFIKVSNCVTALQKFCAHHRKNFNIPIIGITGSNGKTIVKEWLFQLLLQDYKIVRSPKSYNSQVGVPLSVWNINDEHDLGVFEAGISQSEEMQNLEQVIKPTIGVLTNIGDAHDEGFDSKSEKIQEKLKLFENCETVVYCKDDLDEKPKFQNAFTWSKNEDADLKVNEIKKSQTTSIITATHNKKDVTIDVPFIDDASIDNSITCWAVLLQMNVSQEIIQERIKNISPVAMRLQLNSGINGCTIINDSYNSDLGSLSIALDLLSQQNQHTKKTVILSDILQTGLDEHQLYTSVQELLTQKGVNRLIGIGNSICQNYQCFRIEKKIYLDTESFLKEFNSFDFNNEAILLKGSRKFKFEKIGHLLQQKDHQTVLEINLNAITHNLNYYRSKLKPSTKIMAMVKAFSYGSGSYEVASLLQYHKVDYLAVAYADEGVALRKSGITMPIMVMNPESQSFNAIIKYKLEPEIYSIEILKNFKTSLTESFNRAASDKFPIHIKLETGMHRLGFSIDELDELIEFLVDNDQVEVISVFSHLAASDESEDDDFTKQQIESFNTSCEKFSVGLEYPFLKHISNSAGIIRFPDAQMDMVRLGIGLYGIDSSREVQNELQQVSTFKATISQIKEVKEGESVGYNRKLKVDCTMKIGTVGVGYADGLNRKLGNGNYQLLVNGKKVPIVGNVCMDMCMIDVTNIDVNEGDEVLIFGEALPINDMAKALETIPYEILTSVSQRVKRVYYQE
ncbi:MAG: bifunctional UDP-N-acetylmuramoyl-tripeptide:D-alanyl-D-alanine ligase/alanine racemase [Bacteroidia bacterium]|nr:bifunctional UDP-N-acetylmuramoyl-tripeptide:D-alanyl-D-alanine ligase/alanine racemase [Bacteroidia bacterium]